MTVLGSRYADRRGKRKKPTTHGLLRPVAAVRDARPLGEECLDERLRQLPALGYRHHPARVRLFLWGTRNPDSEFARWAQGLSGPASEAKTGEPESTATENDAW